MALIPNIIRKFKRNVPSVPSAASDEPAGFLHNFLLGEKGFVKEHPFLAASGGAATVGMLSGPLKEGFVSGFTDRDMNLRIQGLKNQRDSQAEMMGLQYQRQRVERELATQAAKLAAVNPQLYNQIMAGRRLPQGAVILGGQPRTDLMEQIASSMASNPQLQQPGPMMAPQDQFLNELGV